MEIKEPVIKESGINFITSIWLVPIVAAIVAIWLVYEHYSKLGPEVKIEFKSSGGLVAGQSVVKFRDVEVGKVTKIEIDPNSEGVMVYARLDKEVKPFLNKDTYFWIVKPEVDYSGIRGLDTLFSGSYIKMYAKKKGGKRKLSFKGLDKPFEEDGYYYTIESDFPVKIKSSTPLFFKGIQVGEVVDLKLNKKSKNIDIKVKLYKDYSDLINETTNFWVQSLVNLKFNDNKLDINVAPLPTILLGAIEFNTRFDGNYSSGKDKIFKLFKSETEAKRNKLKYINPIYKEVVFNFKKSINLVDVGMPIKYKNVKIGSIEKVDIIYNNKSRQFDATCYGVIDISNFGTTKNDAIKNFKEIAQSGLVATIKNINPLLNQTQIDLLDSNNSVDKIDIKSKLIAINTIESKGEDLVSTIKDLTKKISNIHFSKTIDKINTLLDKSQQPIDKLNNLLTQTSALIKNLNKTIGAKEFKKLPKNLNKTLKELHSTLISTKELLNGYKSDSLFGDKLQETLKELHNSTEQTNILLHKLNKKPNALIFGD